MKNEFNGEERGEEVQLEEVPDWHSEPGTPLSEFGKKIEEFSVIHNPVEVGLPPEVDELKEKLDGNVSPTFFNGPFANTEGVRFHGNHIEISTKETDLFSYVSSDYFYCERQSENPIRPLAVQATLFSPKGEKIFLERRQKDLTDMPDKLTVFGGALKPDEINLKRAMAGRLFKKWGVEIDENNIIPTGICRENINNIYCAFFMSELTQTQYEERRKWARGKMRAKEKMFYEVSSKSIESLFLGKRDISQWEPLGYYNILYALAAYGIKTPEEIKDLIEKAKKISKEKPFPEYRYPMESYL